MMYRRICKYCGKEFLSKTPGKQICAGPHYATCEICGKEFKIPHDRMYDKNLTTCSKACSNIKRNRAIKAALASKPAGYNAPKTVHHRTCKWCGKEFDTTQPNKIYCDGIHTRKCVICGKEFVVPNHRLTSTTIATTCSVECNSKLTQRTTFEHFGEEYYSRTQEGKAAIHAKRFEAAEKRRQTNLERYGATAYSNSIQWLEKQMNDPSKIDNLKQFLDDPEAFIQSQFEVKPTIQMLSTAIGINESSASYRVHSMNIENLIDIGYSNMEKDVENELLKIDPNLQIVHDERNQISPYELDLYLPQYRIAIECNPASTHNSTINCFSAKEPPIPAGYHKMKSDLCKEAGIFLFHIFGPEWKYNRSIIVSMLRNLLHANEVHIGARNTVIKKVEDRNEVRQFLDTNHRQGFVGYKLALGLYHGDELVSLMTFGRSRHTIGNSSNCWELLRFCNKLNTSVSGGASKLFKHALDHIDSNIISFSDNAHTQGFLYETLGFHKETESPPGYTWVDMNTETSYSRINAQKQNVKKFLKDDTIDLSQTESQIMESHGYVRLYDSGTTTWMYRR